MTENFQGKPAVLSGWGRTPRSSAMLWRPANTDQILAVLANAGARGVIARGLGRSYGDPAQNAGGDVIDLRAHRGIMQLDVQSGLVTAASGTSLHDLMRWLVPLGWFVPVTPGTRYVTVGGAVANDIHGKNHHESGSWGDHVVSITLALPTGVVASVSRQDDPDLFWATIGGIGLTGVILDVTFTLTRIATSRLIVDTDRAENLGRVMELMESSDDNYTFSVAWIDLRARGSAMGRSVLDRGRFASIDDLGASADPLAYDADTRVTVPFAAPPHVLNRATIKVLDTLWFHKAPRRRRHHVMTIPAFFHPLDMIENWNLGYGPAGFLQWQPVIPFGAESALEAIVHRIAAAGSASLVNVLKRFGPGNSGPLSFPHAGWTLSVDIAADAPGAARLLHELDELVLGAQGRLYLAKDSRMTPSTFAACYPELARWRSIRQRVDPEGVLQSDMARRLTLC